MVLKKLSPGMTVYNVKKATGIDAFYCKSGWKVWPVYIKEIEMERELVLASWNGNRPEWFNKKEWSKWRLKEPK